MLCLNNETTNSDFITDLSKQLSKRHDILASIVGESSVRMIKGASHQTLYLLLGELGKVQALSLHLFERTKNPMLTLCSSPETRLEPLLSIYCELDRTLTLKNHQATHPNPFIKLMITDAINNLIKDVARSQCIIDFSNRLGSLIQTNFYFKSNLTQKIQASIIHALIIAMRQIPLPTLDSLYKQASELNTSDCSTLNLNCINQLVTAFSIQPESDTAIINIITIALKIIQTYCSNHAPPKDDPVSYQKAREVAIRNHNHISALVFRTLSTAAYQSPPIAYSLIHPPPSSPLTTAAIRATFTAYGHDYLSLIKDLLLRAGSAISHENTVYEDQNISIIRLTAIIIYALTCELSAITTDDETGIQLTYIQILLYEAASLPSELMRSQFIRILLGIKSRELPLRSSIFTFLLSTIEQFAQTNPLTTTTIDNIQRIIDIIKRLAHLLLLKHSPARRKKQNGSAKSRERIRVLLTLIPSSEASIQYANDLLHSLHGYSAHIRPINTSMYGPSFSISSRPLLLEQMEKMRLNFEKIAIAIFESTPNHRTSIQKKHKNKKRSNRRNKKKKTKKNQRKKTHETQLQARPKTVCNDFLHEHLVQFICTTRANSDSNKNLSLLSSFLQSAIKNSTHHDYPEQSLALLLHYLFAMTHEKTKLRKDQISPLRQWATYSHYNPHLAGLTQITNFFEKINTGGRHQPAERMRLAQQLHTMATYCSDQSTQTCLSDLNTQFDTLAKNYNQPNVFSLFFLTLLNAIKRDMDAALDRFEEGRQIAQNCARSSRHIEKHGASAQPLKIVRPDLSTLINSTANLASKAVKPEAETLDTATKSLSVEAGF